MSLVVTLFSVAVLFVLLGAPFLAALQILSTPAPSWCCSSSSSCCSTSSARRARTSGQPAQRWAALLGAAVFAGMLATLFWRTRSGPPRRRSPSSSSRCAAWPPSCSPTYLLPFEIVGLLLLVAVIAATVVARRRRPPRSASSPGSGPGTRRPSRRRRPGRSAGGRRRDVPVSWYLLLAALLFAIGTAGALTRRNGITIFLSIELMLNAVNLTLVAYSRLLGRPHRAAHRLLRPGRGRGRGGGRARALHRRLPPAAHDRRQPHQPDALVADAMDVPRAALADPAAALRRRGDQRRPRRRAPEAAGDRHRRGRAGARRSLSRSPASGSTRASAPQPFEQVLYAWTTGDARHRRRLPARPAVGGDAVRRHLRRLPDPRLLGRLHGPRGGLPALLRLPEPLHGRDAAAGPGQQLPGDVRRLGRRRPLLLPADRLLLRPGRSRPTPGRKAFIVNRIGDFAFLVGMFALFAALRHPATTRDIFAAHRGRAGAAPSRPTPWGSRSPPSSPSASSSARWARARRSRSTSGCPTPWPARRRSRR